MSVELAVADVGRDFEEERAGIEDRQLLFSQHNIRATVPNIKL